MFQEEEENLLFNYNQAVYLGKLNTLLSALVAVEEMQQDDKRSLKIVKRIHKLVEVLEDEYEDIKQEARQEAVLCGYAEQQDDKTSDDIEEEDEDNVY